MLAIPRSMSMIATGNPYKIAGKNRTFLWIKASAKCMHVKIGKIDLQLL